MSKVTRRYDEETGQLRGVTISMSLIDEEDFEEGIKTLHTLLKETRKPKKSKIIGCTACGTILDYYFQPHPCTA